MKQNNLSRGLNYLIDYGASEAEYTTEPDGTFTVEYFIPAPLSPEPLGEYHTGSNLTRKGADEYIIGSIQDLAARQGLNPVKTLSKPPRFVPDPKDAPCIRTFFIPGTRTPQ